MDESTTHVTTSPPALPNSADGAELRKPHEMVVMVPKSKRVTLTGRRIYNALLQVSQTRLQAMDAMPPADHLFEAPLPAILRTSGSSGEDRTAAKRYLSEMRNLEVDWESTAPGDGVKWRGFSMLSEVRFAVKNGENWIAWSYPPTIMTALRDPQRWARVDLDLLAMLSTYPAVALYEICTRYRDNPSGVTSRKPLAWWANALSQSPAGAERREWRKFKNERVKPAIDEINAETDLQIELIEHKQGRTVVEAQFSVRKKRVEKPVRAAEVVDANLVLRAESLGIREIKLEGLIKEFGDELVRAKLHLLEQRASNSQLRVVENSYSYLRSLLRNGADGEGQGASPGRGADDVATGSSLPLIARPAPSPPPLANPLQDPAWLNERIASIKAEIQGLAPERRQALVDAAIADLSARRLMTAVLSRRVAQGDVLHGVLGLFVVRQYASGVYGPDWDKQNPDDLFADQRSVF